MKNILFLLLLLPVLWAVPPIAQAETGVCNIQLNDAITFTETRVRKTYGGIGCTNLPDGATITDVYQSFLFTNILALGDIEVRLAAGNEQFEIVRTVSGQAPVAPISAGAASHDPSFNGMDAETVFTLSAIFNDSSTGSSGFGLDPMPMSDFEFELTYDYTPPVLPPPVANFGFDASGLSVNFQNLTTGGQGTLSYVWDFGDGSSSAVSNPTHIFASDGSYLVTLTATDERGESDNISKSVVVAGPPPVTANFSFSTDELTANFQSLSGGGQGSLVHEWNFGDGTTSTVEDPTHLYAADGTYSVTLKVTDEAGVSKTIIKPVTVAETPPPIVLDIPWAMYEYGNCTFYVRSGFLEWPNVTPGATYEVQEKQGTTYNTFYTGSYSGTSYSKLANYEQNFKNYSLRVRASFEGNTGSWYNFIARVPRCGTGAAQSL